MFDLHFEFDVVTLYLHGWVEMEAFVKQILVDNSCDGWHALDLRILKMLVLLLLPLLSEHPSLIYILLEVLIAAINMNSIFQLKTRHEDTVQTERSSLGEAGNGKPKHIFNKGFCW